jgi:hypothetical protein
MCIRSTTPPSTPSSPRIGLGTIAENKEGDDKKRTDDEKPSDGEKRIDDERIHM